MLDRVRRGTSRLQLTGRPRGVLTVGVGAAVVTALVLFVVGIATARPAVPAPPAVAAPVGNGPADHPIVVLGASISAGTGSSPEEAWPTLVGRCLGHRVVVGAVPGAGFVASGRGDRGPVVRLLREADLVRLDPAFVVLQAGHNDIGTPARTLAPAVTTAVDTVRARAPRAPLVLITVFAHAGVPTAEARSTDATIIAAARRADPRVVVLDPLAEGWSFPRVADGLHPTAVGQRVLAGHVLTDLARAGVAGPGTCPGGSSPRLTPS